MDPRENPARHVILSALGLAAARPWSEISLLDIAAAARLPLAQVYALFPSKPAVLNGLLQDIDAIVLGEIRSQTGESPRDRLFDLLMRRLELLEPHRAAVRSILKSGGRDPAAACMGWSQLGRSMAAMLEAAGIASHGLAGCLRAQGLAAIYASAVRTWLRDETPDRSQTLAALDRQLRQAERWAGLLQRGRRRPATASA